MNFTPEQDAAITGEAPRLCVDAGAGSGKTRVLVERIVHLVDKRMVPLEQIAAITFTDKAAAEMKARLRETFRKRARAAEDSPTQTTTWRELEQRVDTARISTIHSFCTGFLREYALHIGLDPDFSVLGDAETALMLSDTVRTALAGLLELKDEDALHLVAEYGMGPLRETLESMLRQGPLVAQALAAHDYTTQDTLYASWRAALEGELLYRVGPAFVDGHVAALEAGDGGCHEPKDAREVLRREMLVTLRLLRTCDNPKGAVALLGSLQFKNVRGQKKNWQCEADYEAAKCAQDAVRDWAKRTLSLQMDPEVDLPAARTACALHAVFSQTSAAWVAAKRQANALDFDALIQETLRVLREHATVRADAAAALRHLLIDEFQDTDSVQLEIAQLLCGEPGGPHFFFVGDPKQSIYNFRGAEVELFDAQRAASAGRVSLYDNFRTLPRVIGFINEFFDQTALLRAVGRYVPMNHGRQPEPPDPVSARVEFLVVPCRDDKGEAWRVEELRREEARWIAGRIHAMCAADAPAILYDNDAKAWRAPRFGDFALLFRATSSLYLYEEALRAAGVDFISSAGAGFYRRQEVLDVVNALRVTTAPQDGAALAAFLRGPLGRLSDDTLVRLTEKQSLVEAFTATGSPAGLATLDAEALDDARAIIRELRERRHLAPVEVLTYLYQRTGLEAVALDHHYGLQKASNLRKLLSLARDFAQQSRPPLDRFVRYLAEIADHASLREGEALMQPFGGGAVSLMSIHKSKGLQFPVVFVCDMAMPPRHDHEKPLYLHRALGLAMRGTDALGEGTRPALAQAIALRNGEKAEAESARLLYVAMTRAQDYLFLCGRETPRINTWFSALVGFAGVWPGADVVAGNGWQALVTRAVPAVRAARLERDAPGAVTEALARIAAEAVRPEAPAKSISVSTLLTQTEDDDDEREVAGEVPPAGRGTHARTRGSVVHRLFELWDFHGPPPVAAAMDGAALGPVARRALAEDLRAVAERFATLPAHALVSRGDIARELPFVLVLGETVLHGTIDALVDGVLIDYKTGRFDAEKHARYALQLQLYAAALAEVSEAPTSARLVYVDLPREEAVDVSPAAVAAALTLAKARVSA